MKTWVVTLILCSVMLAGCASDEPAPEAIDSTPEPLPQVDSQRVLTMTLDPEFPRAGQAVIFTADLEDASGNETFEWRINGQAKTGFQVTGVFSDHGDHTVQVAAFQDGNAIASLTETVFVLNAAKGNETLPDEAPTGPGNNTVTGNGSVVLSPAVQSVREKLLEGQTVILEGQRVAFLGLGSVASGHFELELTRSELLTPDWFEIDGQEVYPSFVEAYEGKVAGDDDSVVRLVLSPDWINGIIRIEDVHYRIRVGMQGNFPDGLKIPYFTSELTEPEYHDPEGVEPPDCLAAVPDMVAPITPVGRSTLDVIEVGIILDADAEFLRIFKQHSFPLMVAFLAEVDAIYDYELSLRYDLVGLSIQTDPEFYPKPADRAPLGKMVDTWSQHHRDERETVHLYTGHPSNYAQANCIGGAGFPDYGYTFTTTQWASYTGASALRHTQTYAHELGHILQAHHHYSTIEGELQTVMAQGANKYAPVFSTPTKAVIRGYAETWLDE